MDNKAERKRLVAEYKRTHPEAGVYRLRNTRTGRVLIGSSLNLESIRSKLAFAQKTGSTAGLSHRLAADLRTFGADAFTLDVLEVAETRPDMTRVEIADDLATLEALWRERFDPAELY